MSTSTNAAASIGPFLSSIYLERTQNPWQYVLYNSGGVAILFGVIACFTLYDSPAHAGLTTFSESKVSSQSQINKKTENKTSRLKLFSYAYFYIICLGFLVSTVVKELFLDWGRVYLMQVCDTM